MIRLLFLSYPECNEAPMAVSIMEHLISARGLSAEISADAAIWKGNPLPLAPEGQDVLKKHGIPLTAKKAFPLKWETYDEYNFILHMSKADAPLFFNTLGGDVDEKIHLLSEYHAGEEMPNPYKGASFEKAFEEEMTACLRLLKKLEDWVR